MSTLKTNNIQHVDRSDPSIIINTDGSVNIAGTMTYEDVTNVDAVGIITGRSNIDAQKQVHVGTGVSVKAGGLNVTAGITTVQALQATTGTFSGDVSIADKIIHTGDTDTAIRFPAADTVSVETGGTQKLSLGSATVFNESGADVDFRIESSGTANMFVLDAGNNKIGLNRPTPLEMFEVGGNIYLTANGSNANEGNALKFQTKTGGFSSSYGAAIHGLRVGDTSSYLRFDTGGQSEKMRLDSSGRLLLGTTTEGESSADNLTIADTGNTGITIRSGTTNYGLIYFSDATSGTAEYVGAIEYKHDDNFMVFRTNATERLKVTNNGRVLIGTGAVGASSNLVAQGGLQVSTNGASGAPTLCLGADGTGANTQSITDNTAKDCRIGYPNYDIQEEPLALISGFVGDGSAIDGNSGARIYIGGGTSYLNAVNQIRFYTTAGNQNTTSGTERMRITSSGEMGLGTATPATGSFHIHLTETPELNLFSTQHSQGNTCKLNFGVGQSASVSGNTGARIEMNIPNSGGAMNGELKFHTNGGDNLVEKVRIPAATWGLLVTNLASTGATGGYQTEGVSLRYSGDSTFVRTDQPPVTFTRKGNAGKVIDFYSGTSYAGGVYVNGQNSAAYQSSSDYRLKADIVSMTDGIDKVKQLNPVYYKNKQVGDVTDTTTVYNGFLAHEVQSIIPSLVDGEKDGEIDERGKGYQTLNYAGFAPTAIAAIKELIAKVETLQEEVAKREALEVRIAAIEKIAGI